MQIIIGCDGVGGKSGVKRLPLILHVFGVNVAITVTVKPLHFTLNSAGTDINLLPKTCFLDLFISFVQHWLSIITPRTAASPLLRLLRLAKSYYFLKSHLATRKH